MSSTFLEDYLSEPERYELHEGSPAWEVTRREFFRIVGGGVVVALLLAESAEGQQPQRGRRGGGAAPQDVNAWLHIGEDSIVTVYTGKTEIGQNIRTSLTQAVAEELHTPLERIRMVMADTARVPFDGGTAGSRTTPAMAPQLRHAAIAAREALLDLAAAQGNVERASLTVSDGKVIGTGGKPAFEFGQLTRGQKLMKVVPTNAAVTPADKWTVAGQSVPKVEGRSFVTGTHQYASDMHPSGMLYGKILRPPAFKAKLQSLQTKEAEALPGVTVVRDGDFVGVVAPTEHAATQALAAIRVEWQTVPQPGGKELYKHLKEQRGSGRGGSGFGGASRAALGSIAEGLKQADEVVKATYTIAYIAHVPLEPRVGVAEWADGKMTVWTGTQRPFGVRSEIAAALKIPEDRVRVIVPDMGSGYGGKHTGEAAVEAARLAKAVGKPVKVAWTREEEFTWAYFRPAGVIDVVAGARKDGSLTAWEFHNYNSGGSGLRSSYSTASLLEEFHQADSPLRQGSYRALASTANHFARESHLDDLARVLHLDPLAFRLRNLKDSRMRAVLEAAVKKFGWGESKPPAGHGYGLAVGTEKGSYVATCAEIALNSQGGPPRVVRLTTAFECGAIVNPDGLRNQIEGCALMGLGGALFEEIDFDNGRILNPRFSSYRVPRFRDTPVLETVLVNRPDLASAGAGETPIVTIAPAIGNAICQASGTRIRTLPMARKGLPGKEK